jgi:AhpD family alkylhydroperoxidase
MSRFLTSVRHIDQEIQIEIMGTGDPEVSIAPRPVTTTDKSFDFAALSSKEQYKLLLSAIVPRPIAWVVTTDRYGRLNAAPFSFFNAFATDPAVLGIGIGTYESGRLKDTYCNIRDTGEFVINRVSEELAQAMNITAIDFEPGVSELTQAGLSTNASIHIRPPRIAGSPVALECELMQIVELGSHSGLVLGRVLTIHVREDLIIDPARHYIDTPRLNLIARMRAGWYSRTTDLLRLDRISIADWAFRGDTSPSERSRKDKGAVAQSHSPVSIRHGAEGEITSSRRRPTIMQARMKNPAMIIPGAMEALQALAKATEQGGVPKKTLDLVHLRASQINGCSVCVDMNFRFKAADETMERLFAVAAWQDAPYFTGGERAALSLTEAVTRLSDRSDPVPGEVWEEARQHYDETALASLLLWIATTNVWNRLNVPTKQVAGEWARSDEAKEWRRKQVAAD